MAAKLRPFGTQIFASLSIRYATLSKSENSETEKHDTQFKKGRLAMAIFGSCLCGEIKFQITGPMMEPFHCHCSRCRKQHGAAFRSRVRVKTIDLHWVHGEDKLKYYKSSPGFHRGFCNNCGSPIVNFAERLGEFGVPLGILDDDPEVKPQFHIFVGNKAPWFEIADDLPQHEELPWPRRE